MSVVGGRWDRHRSRTPDIRVAQLIRQALQLIRVKVVVVPQHVIVRWSTRTLEHDKEENLILKINLSNKSLLDHNSNLIKITKSLLT